METLRMWPPMTNKEKILDFLWAAGCFLDTWLPVSGRLLSRSSFWDRIEVMGRGKGWFVLAGSWPTQQGIAEQPRLGQNDRAFIFLSHSVPGPQSRWPWAKQLWSLSNPELLEAGGPLVTTARCWAVRPPKIEVLLWSGTLHHSPEQGAALLAASQTTKIVLYSPRSSQEVQNVF